MNAGNVHVIRDGEKEIDRIRFHFPLDYNSLACATNTNLSAKPGNGKQSAIRDETNAQQL